MGNNLNLNGNLNNLPPNAELPLPFGGEVPLSKLQSQTSQVPPDAASNSVNGQLNDLARGGTPFGTAISTIR